MAETFQSFGAGVPRTQLPETNLQPGGLVMPRKLAGLGIENETDLSNKESSARALVRLFLTARDEALIELRSTELVGLIDDAIDFVEDKFLSNVSSTQASNQSVH